MWVSWWFPEEAINVSFAFPVVHTCICIVNLLWKWPVCSALLIMQPSESKVRHVRLQVKDQIHML